MKTEGHLLTLEPYLRPHILTRAPEGEKIFLTLTWEADSDLIMSVSWGSCSGALIPGTVLGAFSR